MKIRALILTSILTMSKSTFYDGGKKKRPNFNFTAIFFKPFRGLTSTGGRDNTVSSGKTISSLSLIDGE